MQNSVFTISTNNIHKRIAVIIFIISAICFFNSQSQSQVTYCYPDCENDLWNPVPPAPALTHQMTLPCGEQVTVFYRIRNACASFWDIFIEKIQFVNGYEGGQNCGQTMTVTQMVQFVMDQLIYDNPMQFPPTDSTKDTCIAGWRVIVGGCWHPSFPIGTGSKNNSLELPPVIDAPLGLLLPCVFIDCCVKGYVVCYHSGIKFIVLEPNNTHPGLCDYQYQPDCYPACE
ncbi:MAG: hypothetical protein EPN82_06075 [Bacteroidetes bacterium]|nr:MAG: hypothetical protein EPN82_06075 [Bacteroidota bacterium]